MVCGCGAVTVGLSRERLGAIEGDHSQGVRPVRGAIKEWSRDG